MIAFSRWNISVFKKVCENMDMRCNSQWEETRQRSTSRTRSETFSDCAVIGNENPSALPLMIHLSQSLTWFSIIRTGTVPAMLGIHFEFVLSNKLWIGDKLVSILMVTSSPPLTLKMIGEGGTQDTWREGAVPGRKMLQKAKTDALSPPTSWGYSEELKLREGACALPAEVSQVHIPDTPSL